MQLFRVLQSKFVAAFGHFPYIFMALDLVWKAAPSWAIAWSALMVVQGLLPAMTVYLTRVVVDGLVAAMNANGEITGIRPLLLQIGSLALLMILGVVLRSVTNWINTGQSELVQDYISRQIHQQATSLDLSFYEAPEYHDRLERARKDAASEPVALLRNVGNMVSNGITMITMIGILLPFGLWIPLLLFASTLPAFALLIRHTRHENSWRLRTTYERRRAQYYDYLLTDIWSAAEMRLYGLGKHFQVAYQGIREQLRNEHLDILRKKAVAELVARLWALLGMVATMAWTVWQTLQGKTSLGDLILLYQAFTQGQNLGHMLLGNVGELYRNSLYLENLFEFLSLKPQIVDPPQPCVMPTLQQGLVFHNVTFRYPGSDRAALENFSLNCPSGKIVAIVGANGAGKSTLVKMLCRFYDPERGTISLDGIDLRDFAISDLQRQMTVMFQSPTHYATTAAQNIALGDLTSNPTTAQIEAAAEAAGADGPVRRLPEGYDTMLGKLFGGSDLSWGEWQRVAMARAFLRQANLIILDEPTSAMDSWAELEWLARFRKLVTGRTAIIITHRFTTAMQADIIHVMEHGKVVESGTHEELCTLGGLYADSWQQQIRSSRTTEHAISNGHPMAI